MHSRVLGNHALEHFVDDRHHDAFVVVETQVAVEVGQAVGLGSEEHFVYKIPLTDRLTFCMSLLAVTPLIVMGLVWML